MGKEWITGCRIGCSQLTVLSSVLRVCLDKTLFSRLNHKGKICVFTWPFGSIAVYVDFVGLENPALALRLKGQTDFPGINNS